MSHWLDPVRAALDPARAPLEPVRAAVEPPEQTGLFTRPSLMSRPVCLFFRDDDAGWDDARLFALCDVFAARGAPLDLAVIPTELSGSLGRELRARAAAGPLHLHQHGLGHRNHELQGRKCEFGRSRSAEQQRADIQHGRALLERRLGDLVEPFFTPPWNRCTRDTGVALRELGFAVLSRESRAEPLGVPGLAELPVHLDWMARRHGIRVGLDELGARLARAVQGGGPVGVMLHHAVMDAGDLEAVGELLDLSDRVVLRPMSDCARDVARTTLQTR